MSTNQQTDVQAPCMHPAPVPEPSFLVSQDGAVDIAGDAGAVPTKAGLIERAFNALQGRFAPVASAPQADDDGLYALPKGSKVQKVPTPTGTPEGVGYCLVAQGIPLPAAGASWLVSFAAGDDPTVEAKPMRRLPCILATCHACRVRILALIDEFGRVFATGEAVSMPPARTPDVQFKRYADRDGAGCVEVAQEKAPAFRACEFMEATGGIALTSSRVNLGCDASGLTLCAAAAVAFLVFWQFPHDGGYSLTGLGVRDALGKLRTTDVFEAAQGIIDMDDEAQGRPGVLVPGLVSYAAQTLREAGFDGVDAASLGETAGPQDGIMPAGVPFLGSLASQPAGDAPQASQVAQHIAAMIGGALAASGIPGLTVLGAAPGSANPAALAPQIKMMRTTKYADTFYVIFDPSQVNAEGARMLLEAEGLFNRLVGMQRAYGAEKLQTMGPAETAELDAWCTDHALAAADPYLGGNPMHAQPAPAGAGDLDVRMAFARGCECLRLPYRLEYEFDYDAKGHTLVVEIASMPACVMPGLRWDKEQGYWQPCDEGMRQGLASRYAAFSLLACAAVGFWACPDVEQVWVNVRRGFGAAQKLAGASADGAKPEPFLILPGIGEICAPTEPECVLSARLSRDQLNAMLVDADGRARCQADPFEALSRAPHVFSLDAHRRLVGVKPLFNLGDEPFASEEAVREVELDQRVLSEEGGAELAARRVCDLGIFEGASRKEEARRIMESFEGDDSLAAIAQARDAYERTENPLTRAALMRVIEGIATDAIEADSHDEAAVALDDIYGLQAQMARAAQAVGKNPREARRILEEMVDFSDMNGWFVDSKTRCFRYFDSYAARALYGLCCADDLAGRDLALCADEYFMAHYRLSSLLDDNIDASEQAIAHARRCVELAPSVAASYLRLARCYFSSFDYVSEIATLKSAFKIMWNPKDLGLALYWLGYAFCMTDELDAGMACYQRSVAYDRTLADVASTELRDLAERRGVEIKTFTEREAKLVLQGAGIDLDLCQRNIDFLVKAAGTVLDAGNKGLAFKLLGASAIGRHDDAMAPVLSSLEV